MRMNKMSAGGAVQAVQQYQRLSHSLRGSGPVPIIGRMGNWMKDYTEFLFSFLSFFSFSFFPQITIYRRRNSSGKTPQSKISNPIPPLLCVWMGSGWWMAWWLVVFGMVFLVCIKWWHSHHSIIYAILWHEYNEWIN